MFACRNCDRLDVLVFKVPAAMRQNAKMKVDQLKYDVRHLQVIIEQFQDDDESFNLI
jgi:golgi SNAP receptor complex member 2